MREKDLTPPPNKPVLRELTEVEMVLIPTKGWVTIEHRMGKILITMGPDKSPESKKRLDESKKE